MASVSSVANPSNPTHLPPRYEIRRVTPANRDWATAIFCHSNIFRSTVFALSQPLHKTARLFAAMRGQMDYFMDHGVESGLSYCIYDTEYVFKRPESAATGGKLYWAYDSPDAAALTLEDDDLLAAMDFPMVSIAMSYGAVDTWDPVQLQQHVIKAFPVFPIIFARLAALDTRDPAAWTATGRGQVLMRSGTATRGDYLGKGLMSALARWGARDAKERGYRGVQIECLADAVTHVWSAGAEPPFRGEVVSSFRADEYSERDESGKESNPFGE